MAQTEPYRSYLIHQQPRLPQHAFPSSINLLETKHILCLIWRNATFAYGRTALQEDALLIMMMLLRAACSSRKGLRWLLLGSCFSPPSPDLKLSRLLNFQVEL